MMVIIIEVMSRLRRNGGHIREDNRQRVNSVNLCEVHISHLNAVGGCYMN